MELMLTGDAMSGTEAAACGFANRAFPAVELQDAVLAVAQKIAQVPPDVQQFNKRAVHRQLELMGFRAAVRARDLSFRPWPCSGNRPGPICAPFASRV